VRRGEEFQLNCAQSTIRIATLAARFIHDGARVLVHGDTRACLHLLMEAAVQSRFTVVVPEGRPEGSGSVFCPAPSFR
jgi:translation initiation factor 2B subunit (eIF-2B alpha/beta/delta family)